MKLLNFPHIHGWDSVARRHIPVSVERGDIHLVVLSRCLLSTIKKEGRHAFLFSFRRRCAGMLAFSKADDMAPVALGGTPLAHLAMNSLRLQLCRQRLARRSAFAGFPVKLRRLAGRAATGGKAAYDNDEQERA